MLRVGVAAVSRDAAEAGAAVVEDGGNAVDAAITASLVATVTHPAMCSLGGSGYVTVWPPDDLPVTVDGGAEMPGRGAPRDRLGRGGVPVRMEYGGGTETIVGPGSVATPGLPAACALASDRFGRLPWARLVEPARERAEAGFPLPAPSRAYLVYSHEVIYGRDPRSRAALHDDRGRLLDAGETVRVEGLVESLELLAGEGVDAFYGGELGGRIADFVQAEGGLLTRDDLKAYRARLRPALETSLGPWRLATNPPPSVGGPVLAALLASSPERFGAPPGPADLERLVRLQAAVLGWRRDHLDGAEDRSEAGRRLVQRARRGALPGLVSESTLHTSAVDSEGWACAATFSDGYGSGIVPPGTGIWLNNSLGETELNHRGFHARPPGSRLPSNMAPTVGQSEEGALLAVGSPGASRITTAIHQTLLHFIRGGISLDQAVRHPRLHVAVEGGDPVVHHEPGLPVAEALGDDFPLRPHPGPDMYFGGVTAALREASGTLRLTADPRRAGGTAVGTA